MAHQQGLMIMNQILKKIDEIEAKIEALKRRL